MRFRVLTAMLVVLGCALCTKVLIGIYREPYAHLNVLMMGEGPSREAAANWVASQPSRVDPALAVEALASAMKDPSPRVRLAAVWGIFAFVVVADRAVPDLCEIACRDSDSQVRLVAVELLSDLLRRGSKRTNEILAALFQALQDGNELVRLRAIAGLSRAGRARDARPALLGLLKSGDPFVRGRAVEALGREFAGDETASRGITCALKDPSTRVRAEAALVLVRSGCYSDVVPALQQATRDRDATSRALAAEAIGILKRAGRESTVREILREDSAQ
jgi:HEAT repeat protein